MHAKSPNNENLRGTIDGLLQYDQNNAYHRGRRREITTATGHLQYIAVSILSALNIGLTYFRATL